jgi:hypothetical protein
VAENSKDPGNKFDDRAAGFHILVIQKFEQRLPHGKPYCFSHSYLLGCQIWFSSPMTHWCSPVKTGVPVAGP